MIWSQEGRTQLKGAMERQQGGGESREENGTGERAAGAPGALAGRPAGRNGAVRAQARYQELCCPQWRGDGGSESRAYIILKRTKKMP